jgi:hypothetical protein
MYNQQSHDDTIYDVCVDWKSACEQDTHEVLAQVRTVMGFCALDGGLMDQMDASKTQDVGTGV